jgi:hypothetical protein
MSGLITVRKKIDPQIDEEQFKLLTQEYGKFLFILKSLRRSSESIYFQGI